MFCGAPLIDFGQLYANSGYYSERDYLDDNWQGNKIEGLKTAPGSSKQLPDQRASYGAPVNPVDQKSGAGVVPGKIQLVESGDLNMG